MADPGIFHNWDQVPFWSQESRDRAQKSCHLSLSTFWKVRVCASRHTASHTCMQCDCPLFLPCGTPSVSSPSDGHIECTRRLPHPTTQHGPSGSLVFPDPAKPLNADANNEPATSGILSQLCPLLTKGKPPVSLNPFSCL